MISTTRIAILQREEPRDRKLVKDSCPGVSITNRPGILKSSALSYGEGFVSVSMDNIIGCRLYYLIDNGSFLFDGIHREVSSTNLLGDTSSFTSLNICLADFVEKFCFPSVDVSKNTANG